MSYLEKGICSGDYLLGEKCYGYNTYDSHSNIVYSAGCSYYTFNDPRPGKDGEVLYPKRYFINDDQTKIKGINFYDKNGNFACSYIGESYSDITSQNCNDIKINRIKQYQDSNLKYGSKREAIYPKIGDRDLKIHYDTRKIETALPYDVKEIEMKSIEEYPELYDKYDGMINPNNSNQMSCTAVYTNKINERNKTEEVQYVEFRDKKTGENYHYINTHDKKVDEQIAEDFKVVVKRNESEQATTHEKIINQGVKRN